MIKYKGFYLFLAILLIGSILLSACTKETTSNPGAETTFTSDELDISLVIPQGWNDKYLTESSENTLNFYSKNNKEYGGLLFSIERLVGELITEEDIEQAPQGQRILLQEKGYTYILRMPSDVQYSLDKDKLHKEYEEMMAQVDTLTSSIKSIGEIRPEAKIEGYKVIGSSFFTLEIPEEFDIRTSEDYGLRWEIYSGENIVGDMELLPYKSLYDYIYLESDLNKLIVDVEVQRKAKINLTDEENHEEILKNMILTFDFIPSPYTILDVETSAVDYLDGGGKMLFGNIEDVAFSEGELKAITLNLKEFVLDDNADTGFYIEDLNTKEEYSLEEGVLIIPLMPPNYVSFDAYGMRIMDSEFIEEYEHLKDMFYNFIIGADGQLKIIRGFYLP